MPKPNETYSDGDVEEQLLALFKGSHKDHEALVNEILANEPSWPLVYHLSSARENLLNWFSFGGNTSLLEVGSGCGALTALFAEHCESVVALELSERRCEINKLRNGHLKNVRFLAENIENYDIAAKFDYVVSIGVLEYAGKYISGKNPAERFLTTLKSRLTSNGSLILAIENKLGLKYLAGAREDHTGRFYDGVEGYPSASGILTYGRNELEKLLKDCGFESCDFYYPYPDYKLPSFVYSDAFLPGRDTEFPYASLPTPAPDQARVHIFSEQHAMEGFANNNLYPHIANSFLVVAKGVA